MTTSYIPFSGVQGFFQGRKASDIEDGSTIFQVEQVHGDEILDLTEFTETPALRAMPADALLTRVPGQRIGIRTADCVPILLAHPEGLVAAVHAGWRGSQKKILAKTLNRIGEHYGLSMRDLHVAIGPAICQKCYEVGREVAAAFPSFALSTAIQRLPEGNALLDLKAVNVHQARKCGVLPEHIQVSPDCTQCSRHLYYSHRADIKAGKNNEARNLSWIYIEAKS